MMSYALVKALYLVEEGWSRLSAYWYCGLTNSEMDYADYLLDLEGY